MMINEKILEEAKNMSQELIDKRRYLHENAETGFDLTKTLKFVETELINMGYNPTHCGKAGLVATAGGKNKVKFFLFVEIWMHYQLKKKVVWILHLTMDVCMLAGMICILQ